MLSTAFFDGHTLDEPVPAGLDWDGFLGPAQWKPYSKNKFAYNWHWFWDTGNGDIGNQGVHQMDICSWGLGRSGWPISVSSAGGKFVWKDDQETPNTEQATIDFGEAQITFDVRNLPTPPEGLATPHAPDYVGNIFFGHAGYMVVDQRGFQVFKSAAANLSGEAASGADAANAEKYEKTMDERLSERTDTTAAHMKNFFDAIRARDSKLLHADVEIGTRSAALCHLANISYRVGRSLRMSGSGGHFLSDEEANGLLTRNYRQPYAVTREV
jgi:hypothetical protein